MPDDEVERLLHEQSDYYRALAPDYLDGALDVPGADELVQALDDFAPAGDVLELACGPATWTPQLLRYATSVIALDGSPEMLALARERVGTDARVRLDQADLFTWEPDRRYDVVFFGFWLSHVPLERFAGFWSLVDRALDPRGRVFFVDDAHRTPDELIEGDASATIRRRTPDGRDHRAVKVPHTPDRLQAQLNDLGWDIGVHPTLLLGKWAPGLVIEAGYSIISTIKVSCGDGGLLILRA